MNRRLVVDFQGGVGGIWGGKAITVATRGPGVVSVHVAGLAC
jgi:hypothetical protein